MIQGLTKENIEAVINLHEKVLGDTLNSRIGSWFIKRLYLITTNSVDNGFCYIAIEDNEVVGFISFCFDHAKLEKEIMNSLNLAEKTAVAILLLSRPWLLPALIRQQAFAKYLKNNFIQPYASILTLGVSPKAQGRGFGGQLLDKAKEAIRDRSGKELFVDTEEKNIKAAAFYQKNNFQQVAVKCGNIIFKFPF